MKLGYARVSTSEQVPNLLPDTVRRAGSEQVFADTAFSVAVHKPNWQQLLTCVCCCYTVMSCLAGRLVRSTKQLITVSENFRCPQLMACFQIGSRRTRYQIRRFIGCAIINLRAADSAYLAPARA